MTSRNLFLLLIVLAAFVLGYAAYDARHTTGSEAGDEIKEAAQSSADFIKDTGQEIKREARSI